MADFIGLFRRVSEAAVGYAFWIIERRVHTLAIDERDPTPDSALLLATAPYYGLKTPEAEAILARVRQVVATWGEVARRLQLPRDETQLMASAFADRASR